MSSESAEVAEDYRHALEDLSGNMRFEISNLTVIARENTEHALAIADVLQQHILKTAPSKKLPALYVLDSIVKNVGTPYTLYFGRNLFKIFMESYAVVEYKTRQRMEEMLKTWKQPVAGSMDTRPVFSPELVRPIENALMKAKAASMPQGQLPGRPRQAMQPPHRNTPTPPGGRGFGAPPVQQPQHYPYANGVQPGYPNQQQAQHQRNLTPQPASSSSTPVPPMSGSYGAPAQGAGVNVEALSSDIQNLIVVMQVELAQNPHDPSVQTRLKALRDLQGIVGRTALPQDQLELIKKQVNDLAAVTMKATSANNSASATPQPQSYVPPHPYYQQQHHHQGQVPASAPAPAAAPSTLSLDSLLGQGAMAALLARSSSQNTTPTPPQPAHALRSPQPAQAQPQHAPAQTQNPMSLVEQLRAAGLMPAATPSNASSTPVAPPPAPPAAPSLPLNLSSLLSSSSTLASLLASTQQKKGFDSLSLKQQFRPDLVARLHEDLGPPCTQCGRRFRTDAAGKNAKMAHMDWHFKVHQRSTEAEKRGMHRSWYVDHNDWLKSREVVDSDHVASSQDASAQASRAAESEAASVPRYIRVPEPTSGVNNFCSICQDKFENKWLDTAQEWVWLDAVLVGGRAYHASCHDEATRDRDEGGVGGMMRRTPEPLLGKRKADTGLASPKVRSLKTSA